MSVLISLEIVASAAYLSKGAATFTATYNFICQSMSRWTNEQGGHTCET